MAGIEISHTLKDELSKKSQELDVSSRVFPCQVELDVHDFGNAGLVQVYVASRSRTQYAMLPRK